MIDNEIVKQKIQSLEAAAINIEKKMVDLIERIDVIPHHLLICPGTPWDPPDYFDERKFGKPTKELAQLQRTLLREYNEWYHQAIVLIHLYCPNKENQFQACYQGAGSASGILQILNLDAEFPEDFDNTAVLQRLLNYFDTQRAILMAISEILVIYKPLKDPISKDNIQKTGITNIVIQTQDQSQTQSSDINNIAIFKDLRESIEKSNISIDQKQILSKQVESLEKSKNTQNYVSNYQEFMSTIADHITIIQQFIPFLTSLLPK